MQEQKVQDFNVLDLGFFRALQSAQHQYVAKNLDDLIASVNMAFEFMPHTALRKVFLSLQQCMIESLKCEGGNFYKLPHMGKDKMLRNGTLPSALHLDINLVHNTIEHVKNFHSTAPEHARVFELPSLDHLNANAD